MPSFWINVKKKEEKFLGLPTKKSLRRPWMFNNLNLLNFLAKFLCQIVSAGCWKNSMKSKTNRKMFPPKLFLENSDYLEKWNLQLAKFPNFCCQKHCVIISQLSNPISKYRWNCQKNIYHNKCKPIFFITKIVFSK